jgi:peptidoglycan/LPS O-acetylase OafA/YrhL
MPALTGLRGIGALWVLLYHLTLSDQPPVLSRGYVGVDLFFLLSGVVLSYVYSPHMQIFNFRSYATFLQNRVARIFPLNLVTLALLASIVVFVPGFADKWSDQDVRFSADALIASVLLIQNWGHWLPTVWNVPAWSLSAEWFVYLIFPVVLFTTRMVRSAFTSISLVGVCLLVLFLTFSVKGIATLNAVGVPGMARMLCEFVSGCLIYRAVCDECKVNSTVFSLSAFALIVVGLFTYDFIIVPGFALLVWIAATNRGPLVWLLSSRPVTFLGEISYSLYLTHWTAVQLFNLELGVYAERILPRICFVAVIIGLSSLSYFWFERPVRAWARRLSLQSESIQR